MRTDEQNIIIGATFARFQAAQKQEQYMRSKLNHIALDYKRTAAALNAREVPMPYAQGDELRSSQDNFDPPVRLWDRQELEDTLAAHSAAAAEYAKAEADWREYDPFLRVTPTGNG